MNRLQRLYLKEIIWLFLVLSLVFSVIFALIGLFDRYDNYVSEGLRGMEILEVAFLRVPEFLGYLIPLAFMLSSVLVLSFGVKHKEILILRVSGGNIRVFLAPFVVLTIMVMGLQVWVQDGLYPLARTRIQEIIEPGSKGFLYKNGLLWLRLEDGSILKAKGFDPYTGQISDVYMFLFNPGGIKEILHAKKALREGPVLRLKDVIVYDLLSKRVIKEKVLSINATIKDEVLKAGQKRIEEMSGWELLRIYSSLKKAGIENIKLAVDLQRRLSYPVFTIILSLLAMYLSLRFSSPWLSIGLSVLLAIGVWGGITLSTALGYAGTIPPVVAGWILPVLGLLVAIGSFLRIRT